MFLLCLVCCLEVQAETYSLETQSSGAETVDVETITELIKMNFKNEFGKKNELIASDKSAYKLKAKILKLDNLYVINLEKEKGGTFLFSSTIKTPKSAELDQKIARLVRAVIKEEIYVDKVGDITESEKEEVSIRRKSVNRWYVGFGPAWSRKLEALATMTSFAIGYSWEVNSQTCIRTFWDGVAEPGSNKTASFKNLGLGLQYFFNNDNNAPYVLGDLGWGVTYTNSNEEKNNFVVGLGVGYTLFRTSSTSFDLLTRIQTLTAANTRGIPSTFSFRVGVLF